MKTLLPLLTAALALTSSLQAACSMWQKPDDFNFAAGQCNTASGVMLYAPFYSQKVIMTPFEILVRSLDLPYTRRADSPWYAGIQLGNIQVQDFETAAAMTGLTMSGGDVYPAWGVDEDDGIFDNEDTDTGHFYTSFAGELQSRATFAPDGEGRYPQYAGFALVRRNGPEDAAFQAYGPDGQPLATYTNVLNQLDEFAFIGIYAPQGIGYLETRHIIDHVQWGYVIPEPGSAALTLAALTLAAAALLLRRRR